MYIHIIGNELSYIEITKHVFEIAPHSRLCKMRIPNSMYTRIETQIYSCRLISEDTPFRATSVAKRKSYGGKHSLQECGLVNISALKCFKVIVHYEMGKLNYWFTKQPTTWRHDVALIRTQFVDFVVVICYAAGREINCGDWVRFSVFN